VFVAESAFQIGGIVEPPFFVGREDDLSRLLGSMSDLSQSVLLLAPRRFGKSSLLHNLKLRLDSQERLLVPSVNCLGMTTYADLHRAVVSALLSEYERKHRIKGLVNAFRMSVRETILKALQRIEEIGGSVGELGKAYLRFRESEIDEEELLRQAFVFIRAFSEEKGVQIAFLMDEFQELASFDGTLFRLLKKEMDENTTTRYLFSGSSIRLLTSIFLSEEAPLYLMASRHRLQALDESTVSNFIAERLAVAGFRVSNDAAARVHALTGGIPYYVQKLGFLSLQQAQAAKQTKATRAHVEAACARMLEELGTEFEGRWVARLSNQQRRIAKALSDLGRGTVSEIARHLGVERTDISSSLRRMQDMMIVTADEGSGYSLTDVVFSRWLAST
jgi:AAA+ ATPase superfamily predicted ATPase